MDCRDSKRRIYGKPDQQSSLTWVVVKCPPLEEQGVAHDGAFLQDRRLGSISTTSVLWTWAEILVLPFTHPVTLGNLLAVSALQFAHL